jgi:hypothetical protein
MRTQILPGDKVKYYLVNSLTNEIESFEGKVYALYEKTIDVWHLDTSVEPIINQHIEVKLDGCVRLIPIEEVSKEFQQEWSVVRLKIDNLQSQLNTVLSNENKEGLESLVIDISNELIKLIPSLPENLISPITKIADRLISAIFTKS